MAEPVAVENQTPDTDPLASFSSEYDSIATLTHSFVDSFNNSSSEQPQLVNSISDLRFSIDGDFELTFDSVDDLYFPSENESFFIPVDTTNREMSGDFTPVFGGISGDCGNNIKNTNGLVSTTSDCCNQESPMDSDCSGTAQSSTQESVDCIAHVSEATAASSTSSESGKVVVDQKFKVEEEKATKRKKENEEEDTSEESRNSKYRRRSDEDGAASVDEEDDEKRNARLIRNRESAQLSRQRKKHYIEELEDKLKNLQSIITDLNSKVSYCMAENATLRHKVSSGKSMCWPHHQPPLVPVPYPWMPLPTYMFKPQGSQVVPLFPIPRLKPQQSLAKVKKSEAKTKKVASVSVLGLLFCLFLVGALSYGEKDLASEMKNEEKTGVGMCTEMFQFDVSSTSGATIIPASPATQQPKNTTDTRKGKNNRRILRGGLPVSDFNLTKDQNSSSKESFGATKPFPSMVVSVLVDPKEDSDGDIDGTKSLSRVFVVVLVDGVKYVTYSCVLPRPQEVPHLVTT